MIKNTIKVLCLASLFWGVQVGAAAAETGFLGLEIQGFDKRVSKLLGNINQSGVLVKNVAIGEAGAMAGFRRGDLIVEFNRAKINDFDSLVKAVVKTEAGQKISVVVMRNGRKVKLNLISGTRPASWKVTNGAFANYPDIGITVSSITNKVRERFALRWDSRGIVVTLVDKKSKVVATGLQPGDVILQANLMEVWQPKQLTRIITAAKKTGKKEILILIESPGGYRYSLPPLNSK
ncbi:MAG: PDZ domain-containing protein [Rhodospirillaceae bacterium]|nr:PDZ domain-containing protein [Rhodospirillaceae bacterium]